MLYVIFNTVMVLKYNLTNIDAMYSQGTSLKDTSISNLTKLVSRKKLHITS